MGLEEFSRNSLWIALYSRINENRDNCLDFNDTHRFQHTRFRHFPESTRRRFHYKKTKSNT